VSFLLGRYAWLISPVSTRRLHTHTHPDAVPSTYHHSASGDRRITTQSSGDVSELLAQHLNKTFPPLEFPPALAQRVLTHLSHHDSVIGHNSRFAFLGRVASPGSLLSAPLNSCHRRATNARGLHVALPTRSPGRGRT